MNRFLERIAQTKLDGTFVRVLNQIERTHLIILDDFGLQPLDATTRCKRKLRTSTFRKIRTGSLA
jgi:DNA replication protein DnaC